MNPRSDPVRPAGLAAITERARQLAAAAPIRSPERRAAAALHTALITTRTPQAARRALQTFCDPGTRAAAGALLDQLEQQQTIPAPVHSRPGSPEFTPASLGRA